MVHGTVGAFLRKFDVLTGLVWTKKLINRFLQNLNYDFIGLKIDKVYYR